VPIAIVAVPKASDATTAIIVLRTDALLVLIECLPWMPMRPPRTIPWAADIYSGPPFHSVFTKGVCPEKPSVCNVGYVAANGRQVQRTSQRRIIFMSLVMTVLEMLSQEETLICSPRQKLCSPLHLFSAFTASATTNARLSHVHGPMIHGPMIYDMVPDRSAPRSVSLPDYVTDPIVAPQEESTSERRDNRPLSTIHK
jgi:hypothetical protein